MICGDFLHCCDVAAVLPLKLVTALVIGMVSNQSCVTLVLLFIIELHMHQISGD